MLVAALGVSLVSRDGGPMMSAAEAAPPTLAILPLAALGAGVMDTGFVEGLHDDLLTVVSRVSDMRVISRTSVLRYGDGEETIPEIGRALGASAILEGSVQVAGNRIRVNVQLIDARSDEHLWAEIFERPFDASAVFAIQKDIAQAIAGELSVALTGDDQADLDRQPTASLEAYNAYLLGRQRLAARTSDQLADAEAFFRRAIRLDPVYAEAWAGLAETFVLQHDYSGLDRETMEAEAMPAVQRALSLQPRLARAQAVLGQLRFYAGDVQGGEDSFRQAFEINSNESLAAHWYGGMLYGQGRFNEAVLWHRRALELDPLSVTISNSLAQDLMALGRIDEAVEQYERSLEIDPEFVATYAHLAQVERFAYGRPDEAVRLLYEAYLRDPLHSEYPALMAEALLELDAPEAAGRWAERATANAPDHWWPSRAAILVALRSGDAAAIDDALHRAATYGDAAATSDLRTTSARPG
jgi:TolB-like protein/Tfp pilus assembly protein PilF